MLPDSSRERERGACEGEGVASTVVGGGSIVSAAVVGSRLYEVWEEREKWDGKKYALNSVILEF